jgi:hypothetical protein
MERRPAAFQNAQRGGVERGRGEGVSGVGVHVGIGEEGRGGPAQWSAAAPDRWAWAVVLLREKGRVAVHGRRGTRATDRRGRAATGPVVSGGVRERVRESGAARRGALTGGPGSTVPVGSVLNSVLNRFKNIQRFKRIQNSSKFWVIQKLPSLAPKNGNKIWLERV